MRSATVPDFSPESHEYRVNGILKPSVTQIIGEFVKVQLFGGVFYVHVTDGVAIPEEVMKEAQDFGRAQHKIAYHILMGNNIAWASLNPVLVPTANQFIAWMQKYSPAVVVCEQPMYSTRYDYVGTPDLVCWIRIGGKVKLFLIDFKTGLYEMAGPQTAAYEQLYREYSGYKGIIERWVLHLPKDGSSYVFAPLRRRDDMQYFLYRKAQHDWLQKAA
jgi:hypothetical protein